MNSGWIIIYYQFRETTHFRPQLRHLCWAGLGYKIYLGCRPRSVAYRHAIDIVRGVRGGKVEGSNRLLCATHMMSSVGVSGLFRTMPIIRLLHKGEAAGRASSAEVQDQHPFPSQRRGRRPSVVVTGFRSAFVTFTGARPQAERRRLRCKTSIRSLHKGEAAGRASSSQVFRVSIREVHKGEAAGRASSCE